MQKITKKIEYELSLEAHMIIFSCADIYVKKEFNYKKRWTIVTFNCMFGIMVSMLKSQ
jgi:hypothetical protein